MGSFTFSEIFTIVLIILIVFGPNRLPELSRKIGQFLAWGRRNMQEFTNQINSEFGDQTQPLADLRKDVEGVRDDIKGAMDAVTKPLATPLAAEEASSPTPQASRDGSESPEDAPHPTPQAPRDGSESPEDAPSPTPQAPRDGSGTDDRELNTDDGEAHDE